MLVRPVKEMCGVFTGLIRFRIHRKQRIHQIIACVDIGYERVEEKDEAKLSFLGAIAEGRISSVWSDIIGLYSLNGLLRRDSAVKI